MKLCQFFQSYSLVPSRVLVGDFVGGEIIVNLEVKSVYRRPLSEKKKMGQGASIHRLVVVWANKIQLFP